MIYVCVEKPFMWRTFYIKRYSHIQNAIKCRRPIEIGPHSSIKSMLIQWLWIYWLRNVYTIVFQRRRLYACTNDKNALVCGRHDMQVNVLASLILQSHAYCCTVMQPSSPKQQHSFTAPMWFFFQTNHTPKFCKQAVVSNSHTNNSSSDCSNNDVSVVNFVRQHCSRLRVIHTHTSRFGGIIFVLVYIEHCGHGFSFRSTVALLQCE